MDDELMDDELIDDQLPDAEPPDGQLLADALTQLARTLLTDCPIQAILDQLVQRIVELLPVSAAGVTLISPAIDPPAIAASDDWAMRMELLQTELHDGPSQLACLCGEAVAVPNLHSDGRFPTFGPPALLAGLQAVFTVPLGHDKRRLGALDLYRDTAGPLSARSMTAAQTMADVVTAYLINAETRRNLQSASDAARAPALHDALTGLPNRVLLLDRLTSALSGRRRGKALAVLYVDLDLFKVVNDTHGHQVGDELLIAVAQRLRDAVRPIDTLARLSGDEFVVLCEELDNREQATGIAARLNAALGRPFVLSGAQPVVTASIGIAFTDNGEHSPEEILRAADLAMYEAKREGGQREVLAADRRRVPGLERDLHRSHTRGELHLDYQPIVCTADGRINGLEALLRWTHPTRGPITPATFIPLAERSALIDRIGHWVLVQARGDQRRFHAENPPDDLRMSVNVSAHQLMSAGFAAAVGALLDRPDPLLPFTLEITESVFLRDSERAIGVLNDLKGLGVQLALDDFGTGYSSLSYLKMFPVDTIKIDRAFIAELVRDRASRSIVAAFVNLAHDLGMTVVAEGIETAEQQYEITELGCDFYQGYLFAAPAPAAAVGELLRRRADARRTQPVRSNH